MRANFRLARPSTLARCACLPGLLILGGCGGPSNSDVKQAVQDAATSMLGERMAPVIEDVSNVDCREAQGKPGYVCSFTGTAFNKIMNARSTQANEARFVQQNSKWVMMTDK